MVIFPFSDIKKIYLLMGVPELKHFIQSVGLPVFQHDYRGKNQTHMGV